MDPKKKKYLKYLDAIGCVDDDEPRVHPDGTWLSPLNGSGNASSALLGDSAPGPSSCSAANPSAGRGPVSGHTNNTGLGVITGHDYRAISSAGPVTT